MKKIFTLSLFLMIALITYAQNDYGRMSFTNLGTRPIWVEVDNKRYDDRNGAILIRNLPRGYYSVRIYRTGGNNQDFFSKNQVLYNSNVLVNAQYHVDIVVNLFGKVFVDELSMNHRDYDPGQFGGGGIDYPGNPGYPGQPGDRPDRWHNQISPQSFSKLKEAINKEPFEKDKIRLIKQSMDLAYFSVDQVKELLLLFPFDDERLELAKYAYGCTINKVDYFQINEVFTFDKSKEKLATYTRNFVR